MNPELWPIYVSAAVTCIVVVIGLVPKVGEGWTKWLETKRRVAVNKDDADIADLQRQVSNLQAWRTETMERQRKHAGWDREAYRELIRLGADISPPPDLF